MAAGNALNASVAGVFVRADEMIPSIELRDYWLGSLRQFKTLEDLRRSAFFADCGKEIEAYLGTPQMMPFSGAIPRLKAFLRVVEWNIEKGKRSDGIARSLQDDEILKWADIAILNEADYGMNRSHNRHVARDLAESLGMHAVFAPAHFELTKGTDDELNLEGENRESLQGNAILSRHPIQEACIVALPAAFEPYEFEEKRFGRRNCLWARIQLQKSSIWVGSVHLELRNTPASRARQMRHIMEHLPGGRDSVYLLGGDLNANTFKRGAVLRTMQSVFRLLIASPSRIKKQLLHPEHGKEPLFKVLRHHGFVWEGFNTNEETARADIASLEEAGSLPLPLLQAIHRRLEPYEGHLCFKLDWLLAKNIRALTDEQKQDIHASVSSSGPGCRKGENSGPQRLSDHLPIYADFDLA